MLGGRGIMEAVELYEMNRTPRESDLDWILHPKRLVAQSKPTKDLEYIDLADYQVTTLRLNICEYFIGTQSWPKTTRWERWLTYSTWEWVITIVAIILSIVAFISSLIHMWPELPNILGSLVSTAHAAQSTELPNASWNYTNIKDFGITFFVMILCLYSAFVCYHSKVESRRKFAQDTVKFILGFLSGRGMR
jgi:hypothetical protein